VRLYLDTNIVVALFIAEEASVAVRSALRQHRAPLVTSELVRLEVVATTNRKVREGAISARQSQSAFQLMDDWIISETQCLSIEPRDFHGARAMLMAAPDVSLRAPDAFHLTLALRADATLVSHDRKLVAVAPAFGLKTITP
jgi:predicted nucleic acid-binding protein